MFNKITMESFPNLEKEIVSQVQEAFRMSSRQDQKRTSSRHIKMLNAQNK
jgi:hypothetical protein